MSKDNQVGRAAMVADMDRKTARKYIDVGKLPSELVRPRDWRTRPDPFEEHWVEIVAMVEEAPGLEAKTIFAVLQEKYTGRYSDGQLRTLQRHVRRWRAEHGPEKEIRFRQAHRPGEAMQTDFTSTGELGVTILGQVFMHLLCVVVLPFSNWQWATVCLSESMLALRRGLQAALFQLGRLTTYHQTDNSTAATHNIPGGMSVVGERRRPFNDEYLAVMRHFGLEPRTIEVGEKEQNGDVEAGHGALKRRLEQALLLRKSRDFESREAWEQFVVGVVRKANAGRTSRLAEELAAMRLLDVSRLPEFTEEVVPVSEGSTIRVKSCAYSVPSRLIGERVHVRVYEERLEVRHGDQHQLTLERLRGDKRQPRHRIDYRHVVWSLIRKPGAFARYVYREELFPTLTFRRAYDAIQTPHRGVKGDLEYLRVLHLAASTLEADVEAVLDQLLAEGAVITADAVKVFARPTPVVVPPLERLVVDLGEYDALLEVAS
ncbi:MAG: IS21 family transposase [Casimicrobiaceae bacterium]